MTNLPRPLRERLEQSLQPALTLSLESKADRDQTVKWLWSLPDGARIETVLMHYADRSTVCVSSQAGCAMGCTFCATGQAGFKRHLTAAEILEQVAAARRASGARRLSNVVFMGMGEPLANFDAVWVAVERINQDMGLSARHITLSTVGVVPGIRRLAQQSLPVNLAVSLHAANDELRNRLVPINKRYPLALLMETCRQYLTAKGRRISFEWACIRGVNDRPADAAELASLARPLGAHVNLIPLNPTPGYPVSGSSPADVRALRDELVSAGVNATIRRNRGTEIDAACGQLAAGATAVGASVPTRKRQLMPK
jgi:23S rRNA (adenine2503-C2)-methyltransferase